MHRVSDNGQDTEAPLLEKAGFTAYLKSSLSVKEDGGYDFDSATPVVIGANGETQLFTDEKGHLVTIPIRIDEVMALLDMSYSYKCYSDTKDFMKKFVNAEEGAIIYGISKSRIIVIAREAGAVYKVGNSALINTELFEKYLERFREPARELPKHTWNKLKEMTNTPKTGENS